MKSLSSLLKDSRIKEELTQADISSALGYTSAQFVSNWERGLARPPLEICGKLCDLLKISRKEMVKILLDIYEKELRAALK